MIRIQIVIAIFIVLSLLMVFNMVRKRKLDLRYALSWIILMVVLLVLDIFPIIIDKLSKVMGIELPLNTLVFLGFCFLLVIVFGLTISLSNMSSRVKSLTQELALFKKEMEDKIDKDNVNIDK